MERPKIFDISGREGPVAVGAMKERLAEGFVQYVRYQENDIGPDTALAMLTTGIVPDVHHGRNYDGGQR